MAFKPRLSKVKALLSEGLMAFTEAKTPAAAWLSLVSTQDVVGIKIIAQPGPRSGTRPAVVCAVVEGLLEAGLPPAHVIVWDKRERDLRSGGYYELADRYGIRVASGEAAGYDPTNFYPNPIMGQLVYGDLEFGRKGDGVGRNSYVSKLVSREMTKIINLPPLLNHNVVGVTGNLYSLAMGSVDNTLRFEGSAERLATAVPEIYALPSLSDRVVLNIVDALICQYQGEHQSLLHYSAALNQLRFSKDPVALDVLSIRELDRQRRLAKIPGVTHTLELYDNAALLELGTADLNKINLEWLHQERGGYGTAVPLPSLELAPN